MNLKLMRPVVAGILIAMLLSACNLPVTPTPYPTATPVPPTVAPAPETMGANCVVGTWQITDLASYLQGMLPGMVEGATLTVSEVSGSLTYTFNADGTTLGKADTFKINATVTTNGVNLPGVVEINGSSQGSYQVDESQNLLTLTSVSAGNLTASASVAGIPVLTKTPITDLFGFGSDQTGASSVNYQCIGNSLQVSVNLPNLGQRVITLQRVQ